MISSSSINKQIFIHSNVFFYISYYKKKTHTQSSDESNENQIVLSRFKEFSTVSQPVTCFMVTEHCPKRQYLFQMCRIGQSPSCLCCHISETYSHISFFCHRFSYIHAKYNIQQYNEIKDLLTKELFYKIILFWYS